MPIPKSDVDKVPSSNELTDEEDEGTSCAMERRRGTCMRALRGAEREGTLQA